MKGGFTVVTIVASVLLLFGGGCVDEAMDDLRLNSGRAAGETSSLAAPPPDGVRPSGGEGSRPMPPDGIHGDDGHREPAGSGDPNDSMCEAKNGAAISLGEAKRLGKEGECGQILGEFEGGGMCNYETETWWITVFPPKGKERAGCNPACVVNVATKKVEINWRCTGHKP